MDIREKVAVALWNADSVRALGRPRLVPWSEVQATDKAKWRSQADAALEASGYHRMRKAVEKALKHASANGMQDWKAFKDLRSALGEDKT